MNLKRLLIAFPLLAVAAYWGGAGVTSLFQWEYTAPRSQQIVFLLSMTVLWAAGLSAGVAWLRRRALARP